MAAVLDATSCDVELAEPARAASEGETLVEKVLLGAVHGNPDAMNSFVSVTAGTVSPVEFFDPEHIGRIMSAAATV